MEMFLLGDEAVIEDRLVPGVALVSGDPGAASHRAVLLPGTQNKLGLQSRGLFFLNFIWKKIYLFIINLMINIVADINDTNGVSFSLYCWRWH